MMDTSGKVSILLSIYQPDPVYLKRQLMSLNQQDYPNLELLVWNDSPWVKVDEALFAECITAFPVHFHESGENLGYCRAFEKLTSLADGEYITFCDQDDIWLPDKISGSVRTLQETGALVTSCDRAIIDKDDQITCASVRHSSRQHNETWKSCSDILIQNTFLCYAPGLCITARTETAKAAIPFIAITGHDRWLVTYASALGKIAFFDKPVVHYRRHGSNVSGVLSGVVHKKDYYDTRFPSSRQIVERFSELFPADPHIPLMKEVLLAQEKHNPLKLFKYRRYLPDLYLFQIALALCPDFLFTLALKIYKKEKPTR